MNKSRTVTPYRELVPIIVKSEVQVTLDSALYKCSLKYFLLLRCLRQRTLKSMTVETITTLHRICNPRGEGGQTMTLFRNNKLLDSIVIELSKWVCTGHHSYPKSLEEIELPFFLLIIHNIFRALLTPAA